MKNISMMIKPVSGLCNMSCAYCFYCDEAQKREKSCYGQMSEETLKNVIRKTMIPADGVVSYTWQGGGTTGEIEPERGTGIQRVSDERVCDYGGMV